MWFISLLLDWDRSFLWFLLAKLKSKLFFFFISEKLILSSLIVSYCLGFISVTLDNLLEFILDLKWSSIFLSLALIN